MKKILLILLSLCMIIMAFSFSSCGSKEDNEVECKHDVMWIGANCKEKAKCLSCGYTKGDLGEHYPQVGVCMYCDEFQNKEICDELTEILTTLAKDLKLAEDLLKPAYEAGILMFVAAIKTTPSILENFVQNTEKAIVLCADYEELADIKSDLELALKYIPKELPKEIDEYPNVVAENIASLCDDYGNGVDLACIHTAEALFSLELIIAG